MSENVLSECPFCRDMGAKAFHKPSYLEHKTSRLSEANKTTYYWVPGSYDVVSGCPHCGKSAKETERVFETGVTKELIHEDGLRRLREAGLPTRAGSELRKAGARGRQERGERKRLFKLASPIEVWQQMCAM